jgi:hypothetical protein
MRARTKGPLGCLVVCIALVAGYVFFQPLGRMGSRDLGCADVQDVRASRICRTVAGAMEWTWFGHAIVSPGWRPTWHALRHVTCAEQIGSEDRAALTRLAKARDWRLEYAAENLLRLLDEREARESGSDNSVVNPATDNHVLHWRCDAASKL